MSFHVSWGGVGAWETVAPTVENHMEKKLNSDMDPEP